MSKPPKLIMGVVIARCPRSFAGHHCSLMNWALGFRELGWDVWIVEHVDVHELEPPETPGQASPQEEFWKKSVQEFGFEDRECLIVNGQSPQWEAFRDFAADADLFLNYSGQFKRLDLLGEKTRKAYLDVDPGFTQLWVEVCGSDMNFEGHDVFLTVGTTMNHPSTLVPKVGRTWIPTRLPVVAEYWRQRLGPASEIPPQAPWTTIAHWYGYPEMQWQGRRYAGKRESLMEMKDLPGLVEKTCTIATDMTPDWHDYADFTASGWQFCSSAAVSDTIPAYLSFIAASRGEIGIAKEGYVVSRAGWMSDRSVVYLALGKPVVLHDTGWPQAIAPAPGLLSFTGPKDCAEAIARIEADYETHSAGARHLAETLHSPESVILPLLEKIL
ncbi:MAG: hypothetical protein WCQ57_15125 [Verrucomicrobiota bacterium]